MSKKNKSDPNGFLAADILVSRLVEPWIVASICKMTGQSLNSVHDFMIHSVSQPGAAPPDLEAQATVRLDKLFQMAAEISQKLRPG